MTHPEPESAPESEPPPPVVPDVPPADQILIPSPGVDYPEPDPGRGEPNE